MQDAFTPWKPLASQISTPTLIRKGLGTPGDHGELILTAHTLMLSKGSWHVSRRGQNFHHPMPRGRLWHLPPSLPFFLLVYIAHFETDQTPAIFVFSGLKQSFNYHSLFLRLKLSTADLMDPIMTRSCPRGCEGSAHTLFLKLSNFKMERLQPSAFQLGNSGS